MHLARTLVSFLTVENLNLSTTDKVTICDAMSYFLDQPV